MVRAGTERKDISLEHVRAVCRALPRVRERAAGARIEFEVGGEPFAAYELRADGVKTVSFRASAAEAVRLAREPGFAAAKPARGGWVTHELSPMPSWSEVNERLLASHELASGGRPAAARGANGARTAAAPAAQRAAATRPAAGRGARAGGTARTATTARRTTARATTARATTGRAAATRTPTTRATTARAAATRTTTARGTTARATASRGTTARATTTRATPTRARAARAAAPRAGSARGTPRGRGAR